MNIKQLLNKTNIIFYKNKFTYNNLKILPVKNLM